MAETDYWFARRFPVGHSRNAMAPVRREAMGIVKVFLGWMVGGAIAAALLLVIGFTMVPWLWVLAPLVFVGCAAYGGFYFVSAAMKHADRNYTVDDYKAGRVPGQKPYMQ